MLAAALVVAVVAAAGIGFATAYTGTTTNSENTVDVTYVTLSQGGTAKYNGVSFIDDNYFNTTTTWDTATSKEMVRYEVTGDDDDIVEVATGVDAYLISNGLLLLTVKDTENFANYNMTVTTTANLGAGNNKVSYYIGLAIPGETETTYNWSTAAGQFVEGESSYTTWTIEDVAGTQAGTEYTVVVAACGHVDAPYDDTANLRPQKLEHVPFTFLVSSE